MINLDDNELSQVGSWLTQAERHRFAGLFTTTITQYYASLLLPFRETFNNFIVEQTTEKLDQLFALLNKALIKAEADGYFNLDWNVFNFNSNNNQMIYHYLLNIWWLLQGKIIQAKEEDREVYFAELRKNFENVAAAGAAAVPAAEGNVLDYKIATAETMRAVAVPNPAPGQVPAAPAQPAGLISQRGKISFTPDGTAFVVTGKNCFSAFQDTGTPLCQNIQPSAGEELLHAGILAKDHIIVYTWSAANRMIKQFNYRPADRIWQLEQEINLPDQFHKWYMTSYQGDTVAIRLADEKNLLLLQCNSQPLQIHCQKRIASWAIENNKMTLVLASSQVQRDHLISFQLPTIPIGGASGVAFDVLSEQAWQPIAAIEHAQLATPWYLVSKLYYINKELLFIYGVAQNKQEHHFAIVKQGNPIYVRPPTSVKVPQHIVTGSNQLIYLIDSNLYHWNSDTKQSRKLAKPKNYPFNFVVLPAHGNQLRVVQLTDAGEIKISMPGSQVDFNFAAYTTLGVKLTMS